MLQIGKKALLVILLCFQALPVHAEITDLDNSSATQDCSTKKVIKFRGFTVRLENDSLDKTDRFYSHGLAISAISNDIDDYLQTECLPLPVRLHSKSIKLLTPGSWADTESATSAHNIVVKFGQSIFTPKDLLNRDLILKDRPYAGLLYIGMSSNHRHSIPQTNLEVLDTHETVLGIIGPLSLAKEFQDMAHDVYGDRRFNGWDHQLNNEPAAQLAIEKKIRYYRGSQAVIPGFSVDFIRSMGLRLGNIETSANLSIENRVGMNIPNDFGSYSLRPGIESRPPDKSSTSTSTLLSGIHLFTIIEVKLVAYNFSLDGNLFSSSHQVTRRPWVAYGAVGFSFQSFLLKRGYKIAMMHVYNTQEFEEQESHHSYGSLALSVEF